ncbi:YhaN family protein [Neorhodopirellula pilleata]|uniref:YhaN AAA domain-containing protein n=1 Tax=Neorhodopirellula pilleata TaxID=2714738 RepID=A0A5C6AHR1_9BACT|nr:YhaN family protein [Neorhodopirellula pilleata]TWT99007.1 hypothetical protein Pla100_21740 [Neorhodopirellula pilleata]
MRIRQLDLIRIGPFTNQSLTFNDRPIAEDLFAESSFDFHLVYGPNEAGKSSSLRALTQWLFGIAGETKCRDHFVHAYKDLRIGGTIQSHDGDTLTCIRRPGGQASLRAEGDRKKLDPSVLSEFLGGLTREQFETQFGIDIHQLTNGGKAIATGGGEIGESLFAAGSGSANMPTIQKQLDDQCEALFKPSIATKPIINASIADLNAARKEVREKSVKSKDWQRRFDELAELRTEKVKLDQQQIELQGERDRLGRIRDALPAIGQWNDQQRERADLGEVIRLRDDFVSQRVQVSSELTAARSAQKLATEEIESLSAKLEKLGDRPMILDHASAVESLFENLSLYRQWVQTSPTLAARHRQLQTSVQDALKTLGKEPDWKNADALRIRPDVRVRIRDLAEQRSGLFASVEQAKRELNRRSVDLESLTARWQTLSPPDDATGLKRTIAAAQKLGDLDATIATQTDLLADSRSRAAGLLERLPLWSGRLDDLECLSIPSPETVLRFTRDFELVDQTLHSLNDELKRIQDEVATVEESLHTLTMQTDVPTEESLAQARDQRDQQWSELQVQLRSTSDPNQDDRLDESIAELTESVRLCDEMSDRLRREAQRVSEKARLLGALQRCRIQIENNTAARDEAQGEQESIQKAWLVVWEPSGITPISPSEMTGWLAKYDELIELSERIRGQRGELERQTKIRQEHLDALQVYLPNKVNDSSLSTALDACVDRLDANTTALQQFQQLSQQIEDLQKEKSSAETDYAECEQAKTQWQSQWQHAMVSLQCDEELSAKEAQAVLDTIDQLVADMDAVAQVGDQIQTNQQQIESFKSQIIALTESLGGEDFVMKSETSPDQVVAYLHDRLKRARTEQTSRDHLLSQRQEAETRCQKSSADIEVQMAKLSQLCREAQCDSADQLPEIEQRSIRCRGIDQAIAEKASELRGLAQGADLETFIAEALQEDPDRLNPRIEQLNEQLTLIERERTERSKTIWEREHEFKQIDGNDQAAIANENAEEVIARLQTQVDQYVRTKLGSAMLRSAVARYRKRNQGPVLKRASELFASFTLSSFSGIDTDTNDENENVIVGVRGGEHSTDRRLITVDQMSEGTCDQLFLALRIASLEWHLESNPPVPFIVDDILLKFDDQRSAATLRCLGELSCKTQVILFTHHEHLIDVAREALPADVLQVHSLGKA